VNRFFDVLIALMALLLLFIPMLIISLALKVSGIKKPIFVQKRLGYLEKEFKLYKFKSMTDAVDGNNKLLSDEERLTVLGRFIRKTSLDESQAIISRVWPNL